MLQHSVSFSGGAAGAVSRITGTVGKGLAALTLDDEYQQKRRQQMSQKPTNLGQGLAKGGKSLFKVLFHLLVVFTLGTVTCIWNSAVLLQSFSNKQNIRILSNMLRIEYALFPLWATCQEMGLEASYWPGAVWTLYRIHKIFTWKRSSVNRHCFCLSNTETDKYKWVWTRSYSIPFTVVLFQLLMSRLIVLYTLVILFCMIIYAFGFRMKYFRYRECFQG